jgi:hypothetical protein
MKVTLTFVQTLLSSTSFSRISDASLQLDMYGGNVAWFALNSSFDKAFGKDPECF